ncbi:MAG: xanthine and dehydrogenase maturation factor [Deltaproteobacteria bacterium]|nr:xanthine and dehydrogenase maturation factor [Deltaproteobacteria bacterium]
MREILSDLDQWAEANEEIALATLVRVRGSAPRLPGARLCVTRSGKMTGSVSGGCVENDVFERAIHVLDTRRPAMATYGIADEVGFELGLSCGGSLDVLIEPFIADTVWRTLRQAVDGQRPAVLCIGLAPAELLGRKLVVLAEDQCCGSFAPDLDEAVIAEARGFFCKGGTAVIDVPWHGDAATIFVESLPSPERLFVIGATHTAAALCRMAKGFGFHVTVVDARGTYATRERFPDADVLVRAQPGPLLEDAKLDASSYVVVLTHDPKFDIPALTQALRSAARYIGVMGSRSTHARRRDRLVEEGVGPAELARVRAPIGLDIGARTPEEMALSILAEMVAAKYGADGSALVHKRGAIHAAS